MDESDLILNNIGRYVALNTEEKNAFRKILKKTRIRKRQFIVQPGFVCNHQNYVIKGTLRAYFLDDNGNDYTLQFAIEDWFISDFNSYISQSPASLFVEAIEDSVVFQLEYDLVEQLCKKYPRFERFFRMVAQRSFAFAQRRILSNLGKTAEERYLEFLDMYPDVVRRVPQYALASYLGMSAEFLSKIRKNLRQNS